MKIRIQGNSIRYRLKEPEVADFKKYGSITETIQLGEEAHQQLHFQLHTSDKNTITINFSSNITILEVPREMAHKWTETDLVGFDAIIDIGRDKALKVLVEKDFKCLDGNESENEGAYPNPKENC